MLLCLALAAVCKLGTCAKDRLGVDTSVAGDLTDAKVTPVRSFLFPETPLSTKAHQLRADSQMDRFSRQSG